MSGQAIFLDPQKASMAIEMSYFIKYVSNFNIEIKIEFYLYSKNTHNTLNRDSIETGGKNDKFSDIIFSFK